MKLLGKIAVAFFALASVSVAQAYPIEVTITGTIIDLVDPTDKLGYGTGDGQSATMSFTYDTDTGAPDYYGEARFPVEADYFTLGNSLTAPSWVSSRIVFDNGESYSPDDYSGTHRTTDQVKIIERDAGSPFDYIGFYDERLNTVSGGHLGAVFFEYTDNLVNGISIEQFLTWTGDDTDYPLTRGRFAFVDNSEGWSFNGRLVIDSLTVCSPFPGGGSTEGCFPGPPPFPAPEPTTLALLAIGLFGMGLARRKKVKSQ